MPRFFSDNIVNNKITITDEDARHISKVLRLKCGDEITVCDMIGFDYKAKIDSISDAQVTADITDKSPSDTEPNVFITLYQAIPKADKLDLIVQKATELGVSKIVPILTHRCVSRPDEKSMDKKIVRLQKIVFEAAKQSGRGIIPQVMPLLNYENALKQMSQDDTAIIFYEDATASIKSAVKNSPKTISVMIGAEGGFEQSEISLAKNMDINISTLGKRILRCETAPICALSVLFYETGNI